MGTTKTDLFTTEQNALARLAKALGHPARIAILQHLLNAKACINSDLVQETGLAQATVSQHLRELKDLGLIQGNIEGSSMNYCINPTTWQASAAQFKALFAHLPSDQQCC
jgi:DNA-binding transcriptional ArsR family regulator